LFASLTSKKRAARRKPGNRQRTLGYAQLGAGFQELEPRRVLAATLAMDIYPVTPSSNPAQTASLNGSVLFAASDGFIVPSSSSTATVHGTELWRTDGSATVLVKNINPNTSFDGVNTVADSSNPTDLTASGGFVYFTADDGTHGKQLWRTDGTTAGTVMVTNINSSGGGFDCTDLTDVNGTLYFTADDGTDGLQVWVSDGTSGGTIMVSNLQPTSGGAADPADLTNVNGTVFFTANAGTTGRELYRTNGTLNSTHLIINIYNGSGTANPTSLTNVNGTLFFAANDGIHGNELWKSNGTTTGTVMVSNIDPTGSSNPTGLTNVNGTVFFAATNGTNGIQLWKSDGTAAGTVMVKDINTTSTGANSNPADLTNVDGVLFFRADDGVHGSELWKSDGTTSGTVLVKDINPGAAGSTPDQLINGNGTLFFAANNGTNGVQFWQSDGTSAGTVQNTIINPSGSSSPTNLTLGGSFLMMAANDGTHGVEPWVSPLPTARPIAADASYTYVSGSTLTVAAPGVLTNASSPSGLTLSAVLVSGPSNGSLTLNADGSFTYTPNAGFLGQDSFTYQATDGVSSSLLTATVTLSSQQYVWVENLYTYVLSRAAGSVSDSEIMYWVNQLAAGESRAAIASSFVNSTEARTNLIVGYFVSYLDRAPDAGALAAFLTAMNNGVTAPQIQAEILSSNEYFLRGGSYSGFVVNLYANLLSRTPSTAESSYWVGLLNAGVARSTVVNGILTSQEYYVDVIQLEYQTYLHRSADSAAVAFWVAQFQAGVTPQQMETVLVASPEFYAG
jgi:ELWxxDGT repeat protein